MLSNNKMQDINGIKYTCGLSSSTSSGIIKCSPSSFTKQIGLSHLLKAYTYTPYILVNFLRLTSLRNNITARCSDVHKSVNNFQITHINVLLYLRLYAHILYQIVMFQSILATVSSYSLKISTAQIRHRRWPQAHWTASSSRLSHFGQIYLSQISFEPLTLSLGTLNTFL